MILPDVGARNCRPELMDTRDLAPEHLASALRALARVNMLSRVALRIWSEVRRLHKGGVPRPIRVLDVACGGGDVAVSLARRAARSGLDIEIDGCDVSPAALEIARQSSKRAGVSVRFFELDALRGEISDNYDIVCSSLFLHHLGDADAVALLAAMADRSHRTLLVQDLRRTVTGYILAYSVLRVISRSDVAHTDGLRSVEGAFSLEEARDLAERAGLDSARVEPCSPQRFRLIWHRA